jgi:hypothetical protein
MGMFDSILVAKSLLDDLVKEHGLLLEQSEGYYDFQTKDLDNSLTTFYIQADGSFVWKKQKYKCTTKEENPDLKWPTSEPVGDPEFIPYKSPVYIEFYDLYTTEEDRFFVTFIAHVNDGKLVEPIKLKEIEKNNLKEEAERNKPYHEKWEKIRASFEWQVAEVITNARWKINRIFYPFSKLLDDLNSNLRSKAKKKYLDENDPSYW